MNRKQFVLFLRNQQVLTFPVYVTVKQKIISCNFLYISAENSQLDDLYTSYRQRLRKSLFISGLTTAFVAFVISAIFLEVNSSMFKHANSIVEMIALANFRNFFFFNFTKVSLNSYKHLSKFSSTLVKRFAY